MMRELLLIPLFFLCAWIMRVFVKLVDRFIERSVIREDCPNYAEYMHEEAESLKETAGSEEAEDITAEKPRVLDKLRRKSKVMHKSSGNTVQIGTARPTQIRIHHYE